MQKSKLDQFFSIPAAAVLMAIVCNVLWGSAFPFIKLGYRLFAIDSADTASILCFAGVRFMIGAALVWLAGLALNHRPLPMPRGKTLASACGLGLWQTAAQYFFYYSAVALLTGAMGGILNSTQSFMGVILAHFLYGNKDRLTPRKALGCALGFGGVLVATLGNHGGGSVKGMAFMLIASVIFALAGPWNKAVTQHADSFSVSVLNLGVGGLALAVLGFAMGGGLHPQSAAGIPVLLFLAFISGAGYVIWALLMKNNPVSRIAVFGLIIPIMNVLLSALLNGEPLFEWNYLAALVLVCIGIFLVSPADAGDKGMNNIFDTHAHYSSRQFDADRAELLTALPAGGVVGVLECATHSGDAAQVLELAHAAPYFHAALGIHPESLIEEDAATVAVYHGDWRAELAAMRPLFADKAVAAVGEIGLDHHWPVPRQEQYDLFEAQLQLAKELDLPVSVHDREAHAEMYELLRKYKPRGALHCYSGSADDAAWLVEQGMYLGFGGAVTYKGAKRAARVLAAIPHDRALLETDCPYMAPEPVRGTRNDSRNIVHVAAYIGTLWDMDAQAVLDQTAANARACFGV